MINELVRPELQSLPSYRTAPKEEGNWIILDGNENPHPLSTEILQEISRRMERLALNRYPDPNCTVLRQKLSQYIDLPMEQILVGNGSDEMLHDILHTFLSPGEVVLALSPTFAMYRIFTEMQGGVYEEVPLFQESSALKGGEEVVSKQEEWRVGAGVTTAQEEGGSRDVVMKSQEYSCVREGVTTISRHSCNGEGVITPQELWSAVEVKKPKILILCSPNNPTGTTLPKEMIEEVASRFKGIIIVDEAYGEFGGESMIPLVKQFPNLIVTRTFSKALGVAGVRLGYLAGQREAVNAIQKVVPPYHLNSISQLVGEVILDYLPLIEVRIKQIIAERERIVTVMRHYGDWQVYPSKGNFLFVRGESVPALVAALKQARIRVRKFDQPIADAIRISIGTPEENDAVVKVVQTLGRKEVHSCSA